MSVSSPNSGPASPKASSIRLQIRLTHPALHPQIRRIQVLPRKIQLKMNSSSPNTPRMKSSVTPD